MRSQYGVCPAGEYQESLVFKGYLQIFPPRIAENRLFERMSCSPSRSTMVPFCSSRSNRDWESGELLERTEVMERRLRCDAHRAMQRRRVCNANQLAEGGCIAEPTNENVLFAFEPRVVMAAMHTTTIRANITAYSTAVGPSSFLIKFTSSFVAERI